ncbi:FHA domain-containing protein [Microbacterium sp. ASV49]|uniref:FHA domain-containing protein n=1 Tax=Microbacterium candidum TaxID=3041922 RepID=A0ABT7MUT6_9MICO|nr:FHA domain-containing protein [Microbacterium sp. ASV49]MDL9978203.1 FHA domain-containing protein [Microbacterium sp. ASV49]
MNALYAPGRAAAIVSARALVVVDADLALAALTTVWRGLDAAADLGSVLGLIADASGAGLTRLPDFAVALAEEGGVRIALRGGVTVQAGTEALSAGDVSTWVERALPGATSVTVAVSGSEDDAVLPAGGGIVFASRVSWSISAGVGIEQSSVASRGDDPSTGSGTGRGSSNGGSSLVASAESVPGSKYPSVPEPVEGSSPSVPELVEGSSPSVPELVEGSSPAPTKAPAAASMIDSAAVLSAAAGLRDTGDTLLPLETADARPEPPSDTAGYDHLWGATIVRSVEDAAVRPEEEPEDEAPAPATLDEGDHDGATISIAQARALRAERQEPPAPLAPPRLPAPARIRLSTGQVLNLDRTVVIGRRPRSTRVSGTDLPHLVAVDSPQQDISRSHLELRVDAGAIVATDLHTTNGSMLLRPGSDPVRLHPGESTVVVIGDVVDLGDGVTVTIEETA